VTRHTLAATAAHTIEVKHSRFLARAAAVETPDAAMTWLRASSDVAATHNCWAWRIGEDYRSSDDGEPAGTAGRPILAAIDGQGFDRVAVVVTRWYGGIKLGAGGLVRAYGGAAAECLRAASRLPIVALAEATIAFDFEHTGAVHAVLAAHGAEKLSEQFAAQGARLRIRVPEDALPALRAQLRDATRGRVALSS
jgi:uncharacterized YigZ family protein